MAMVGLVKGKRRRREIEGPCLRTMDEQEAVQVRRRNWIWGSWEPRAVDIFNGYCLLCLFLTDTALLYCLHAF
jgi:hypothetical protein